MKIFLTGATGFIGQHILQRLRDDGHEVLALVRRAQDTPAMLAAGAKAFQGTLEDEHGLCRALLGCDAIVHCAAHLRMWGTWAEFEASNVSLTRVLLGAAQAAGVKHFIHLSAASVVMDQVAPLLNVDETAATTRRRDLPYSSTKAIAEELVLQAASDKLRTLALRAPLVWGAGDTVDRDLGERVARGRFGWFNGGHYPYATCHVTNVCEAVSRALQSPLSSKAYFVTDGEPVELRNFLTQRLAARGLPAPSMSVPVKAAWIIAGVAQNIWTGLGLTSEPPLTREAVRLLGYPFTLNTNRIRSDLGYRPIVTVNEGLEQLHLAQRKLK